jgi:hypothetical protein
MLGRIDEAVALALLFGGRERFVARDSALDAGSTTSRTSDLVLT